MANILVTAGGAGLGEAVAKAFIENGDTVFIRDINDEALGSFKAQHSDVHAIKADMGQAADVDALFARIDAEVGGLDVLVNNAGIPGPRAAIEDITLEDWQRSLDVNLTGAFRALQHAIPMMKSQRSGCIVNITTGSLKTGLPNRSAYIVSKSALAALSYNAARELGPWNIRCNTILPGLIANERGKALVKTYGDERGLPPERAEREFLSYFSMRSMIDPEEIAAVCVFLASNHGRHITGQSIGVDGNIEWEA
ncbi:MAG: SDR family oxidoreductase [Pseudomonadota bacterium]